MLHNRLFAAFAVVALVVLAALTARQAVAATQVISSVASQAGAAGSSRILAAEVPACPFSAADRLSLTSGYVEAMGIWVPRTARGATGIDGGLLALRDC